MIRNFLTIEEVLAIHHHQIQEFGGEPGLLNFGALESALMRPQIGYYSGIIEQASAMMESLAMNHPFVDGNKRVAFFATDTFLSSMAIISTATALKLTVTLWRCLTPTRSGSITWWLG